MKSLKELIKEQTKLLDELEILDAKVSKQKQTLEGLSSVISERKEQNDFGSFKFILNNIGLILQKIAPKHKILKPRDVNLNSKDIPLIVTVPYTTEECSDEDPCNTGICDRCTILHFRSVMDRLLAGYYVK